MPTVDQEDVKRKKRKKKLSQHLTEDSIYYITLYCGLIASLRNWPPPCGVKLRFSFLFSEPPCGQHRHSQNIKSYFVLQKLPSEFPLTHSHDAVFMQVPHGV